MPLEANIDRRGRRIRGFSGLLFILVAIAVVVFRWLPVWWEWVLAILLLVLGLFQLFEARQRWCALKALHHRTRS